jgi:hypothetical protein
MEAGGDIYRTHDGNEWFLVTLDGFGDRQTFGFRAMESVGTDLFIGTANTTAGLEIWRGR